MEFPTATQLKNLHQQTKNVSLKQLETFLSSLSRHLYFVAKTTTSIKIKIAENGLTFNDKDFFALDVVDLKSFLLEKGFRITEIGNELILTWN